MKVKSEKGSLAIRQASVSFRTAAGVIDAIHDITLNIEPGEFVAMLGPSGCGKSTLLGAIAGFNQLSSGEILMDGKPVREPSADRGFVFQQHTLFPWKTVFANVEFGLKMRRVPGNDRRWQVHDILERVGLKDFARYYPDQLSGGMQQRVNLARVLVNRPNVILMDEPFGALDAQTRLQMQELLLSLWEEDRMTVIFVTHDVDEAIFLSDEVAILSQRPGRIKAQISVPLERPRSSELLTSAEFIRIKRECLDQVRVSREPALGFERVSGKSGSRKLRPGWVGRFARANRARVE
jgi:NitT/TauT family transport system ATP-binding protein